MNRTKQSMRNMISNVGSQLVTVVFRFVVRTIFINYLGNRYASINALFINILSFLSIAELGFGSAISVVLYKLLENKDESRINSYLHLFRLIYFFIGCVILILGVLFMPFLDRIINGTTIKENVYIVFLLYLIDVIVNYVSLAYRTVLISADQRNYYVTISTTIASVIIFILQIVAIIACCNYYLYLIIPIVIHILFYNALGILVGKLYPYIKAERTYKLSITEKNDLKKNVLSVLLYRVCTVFNSSADSIIISAFVGTLVVGVHSNYIMIVNAISTTAILMLSAFAGSVGNLNVSANEHHKKKVFLAIDYFGCYIYGIASVCLLIAINPFIEIWIGVEYTFDISIVFVIIINFFSEGVLQSSYVYRNACGLFRYGKSRPIFTLFINVVLSIILAKAMGIYGVILATIISRLLTTTWFEPYLVYKKVFHKSPMEYYGYHLYYLIILAVSYAIILSCINKMDIANQYLRLIVSVIISCFGTTAIFIMSTIFLPQSRYLIERITKWFSDITTGR